jgi:hypothetical protein
VDCGRDPESGVRLQAFEALAYRQASPVLLYAVQDSVANESEVVVRREAVRAGMRWSALAPTLTELLRQLAHADPDEKIRQLSRSFA